MSTQAMGGSGEGARRGSEGRVRDGRRTSSMGVIDLSFALGAVAMTGAAYVLGIAPVQAAAMDDGRARSELVKLEAEKRKLAEDYRSRRGARDAAAESLEGSVRLAPDTEINARRAALAALAEESAIQIQATKPLPTLRGKRFDLVPIEIDGVGSATDFARFAAALGEGMPDTAIRSFELSVDLKDNTPRFTAQLVWYTLPEGVARSADRGADRGGTAPSQAMGSGEASRNGAGPEGGGRGESALAP